MQKINVVQEDAGVVGELEEASSAALNVRLADGQHVSVSREQLEPMADGTLLLKTPVDQLPRADDEQSQTPAPVLATTTIAVQGGRTTMRGGPAPSMMRSEQANRADESLTIPRVEEQISVEKQQHVRGTIRVHVVPRERKQTVSVPIVETHAEVRRVEIGRIVESAPPVREEGDTVIIPVVEEVLVVEKRLLLREEIHVQRSQRTRNEDQEVSLRSEQVEISRDEQE